MHAELAELMNKAITAPRLHIGIVKVPIVKRDL